MSAVLNEQTRTVHKHEVGASPLHTECGVTYTTDPHRLETVPLERALAERDVSKCGRCFDDGGGY